jgi:hypothetical protein
MGGAVLTKAEPASFFLSPCLRPLLPPPSWGRAGWRARFDYAVIVTGTSATSTTADPSGPCQVARRV